ncbi:MAG TPA: DUF4156 domain-containing protein, partial [Polyangiaceae bacterium]|nr:DUF4156 domain-containing protein [Polyangiaceae bacterium]
MIGLGACSNVVALNPAASAVTVSKDAPAGCKDLGEVFGKSNDDEQEAAMSGARNDIKNKALAMGANYVVLETNNASEVKGNFKPGVEILLGGR